MNVLKKAAGVIALVGLFLGCTTVPAGDEAEKPGILLGGVSTLVATVEAIDLDTREVVLRNADGDVVRFVAGDEVRNLAQVEVGDRVVVEHSVALLMMAAPATGGEPERAEMLDVWRAELGQKPGALVEHTVAATGIVRAVDEGSRTVTIDGAQRTVVLEVADDFDLGSISVGDEVNALYRESIAIKVEAAPAGQ